MVETAETYQKMEENDNGDGQKRVEAAGSELGAPRQHDDGVVGNRNDGSDQ